MIKQNFYKAILFNLTVLFATLVSAQNKTTVKATVDRSQILIGEQIRLTLEADIPENEPIRFFQLDTLPHFEFLQKEKIDTSNTGSGTRLQQVILITSFDSGHWVIPMLPLGEQAITDSIPVDIGFSTPFDPQQAYHDVKDIMEVKPPEEKKPDYKWWYIGGGALLLLIVLLYFLLRTKKKPVAVPVFQPPVDPFKEAMDKLEQLKQRKTDSKQYYSELVDIFRVYVLKKKDIHSMQNTTEDLVRQLRGIGLGNDKYERLSGTLRLSDLVKFAKYIPSGQDDQEVFATVKQTIQSIEELA